MVADFLAYDGWEVSYLGADTPITNIRDMVAAQGVGLLLTAASLPQHVPLLRELVASLRRNPATSHVRVVVGGHISCTMLRYGRAPGPTPGPSAQPTPCA